MQSNIHADPTNLLVIRKIQKQKTSLLPARMHDNHKTCDNLYHICEFIQAVILVS